MASNGWVQGRLSRIGNPNIRLPIQSKRIFVFFDLQRIQKIAEEILKTQFYFGELSQSVAIPSHIPIQAE